MSHMSVEKMETYDKENSQRNFGHHVLETGFSVKYSEQDADLSDERTNIDTDQEYTD